MEEIENGNIGIVLINDMRRLDALVIEFPETYECIGESDIDNDIDKTYKMPKTFVSYHKPRRLSEEQRNQARGRMNNVNARK